jgi:hypothetical protein
MKAASLDKMRLSKNEISNMTIYNETSELWKLIMHPSIAGYEASNLGRIRNAKTGKVRKLYTTPKYYTTVSIGGNNYLVHRLVASAFFGRTISPTEFVRHRDDDGMHNALENLTLGTRHDNMMDRRANDRSGWKLRQRDVRRMRADLRHMPLAAVAHRYGISRSHVGNIRANRRWSWCR